MYAFLYEYAVYRKHILKASLSGLSLVVITMLPLETRYAALS